MSERKRDPKREHEDKVRCANYLLQMFIKYGALVKEEAGKESIEVQRQDK